jgi:hypothetical protein
MFGVSQQGRGEAGMAREVIGEAKTSKLPPAGARNSAPSTSPMPTMLVGIAASGWMRNRAAVRVSRSAS